MRTVFECVLNISEGRNLEILDVLSRAAGPSLRDRHCDAFHHRSVFTLINEPTELERDARLLMSAAYDHLDLTTHEGVHPRFGVVDVVPFVALDPTRVDEAVGLRDDTARWLAATFDVPVFLYGPVDDTMRTLPEIRRRAFSSLRPDVGPSAPSPQRGACAVGQRPILVAWNLWLRGVGLEDARALARAVRSPAVRTLAFEVGDYVQVSCNVIDTAATHLSLIYDQVRAQLGPRGAIDHAELVGLAPLSLLVAEEPARWGQLDLSEDRTIESFSLRGDEG